MVTKRKSPKQGLTSANDLTIMLPNGRDYIDQTKLTNLTYSLIVDSEGYAIL